MTPAERREHIRQHLADAHTNLRRAAMEPCSPATDSIIDAVNDVCIVLAAMADGMKEKP